LNELYEQFGYWPFYSIRSLASLFIQIPILIAAYEALSDYAPLRNIWLGYPDKFLAGFNLLPFVMTIINLCAVFISSEPESKERKQGIFIAMVFLVLLYTSPAALLIYWTFNQLFTLARYLMVYSLPKIKLPNFSFAWRFPFSVPNLKRLMLNISVMAFPAILIFKSNEVYFDGIELTTYVAVLLSFSVLVSFISFPRFSVSLILSVMFLPMIRELTHYMSDLGISFAVLFVVVFIFIGSVIKHNGAIIAFSLVASFYPLFFAENANSNSKELKGQVEIPEELAKFELKDSASIYVFMHDAFPHRDYAEYFNMPGYNNLMGIFKQNDFKVYDVYSMGYNTLSGMASFFNISTDLLPKQSGTPTADDAQLAKDPEFSAAFHSGYMRSVLNGNNISNMLLQKNGYNTMLSLQGSYDMRAFRGDKYYDSIFTGFTNKYENKAKNQVLKSILKGTLNSDLVHGSPSSYLVDMAKFTQSHSKKNKLFIWGAGCPGHSSQGGLGTAEKEFQRFIPIYNMCIAAMKEEIEILKADSNAIIVFMSDHGGFFMDNGYKFSKNYDFNKLDYMKFRDIFGAFMAVRWPNREKAEKYDGDFNVSPDLFPIVFAYLFDSEVPLKYKIKDTELRIGHHKFDKGIFYHNFYSGNLK
jgi:hypothetical protein